MVDTLAPAFGRLGGEIEGCSLRRMFVKNYGCTNTVAVVVASGHTDVQPNANEAPGRARYVDTELVFRSRGLEFFGWPTLGVKVGVTTVDGFGPRIGAGLEASKIAWGGDHVIVVPSLGIKAVAGMSSRVGMSLIPALRINAGVRF